MIGLIGRVGVFGTRPSLAGEVNDFRSRMPSGSTYTRTGPATALTADGVIQSFAANAPQRTNRGLVIEPAATNLLLYSTALLNGVWLQDGGASAVASPAADPAGGTSAVRLTLNDGLKQWYQNAVATGPLVLSAYVKTASGSTNVRLNETHSGGYTPSSNLAVTSSWQRIVYAFTPPTALVNMSFMTASGGVTSPIDAWGVQLETGTAPTSPIITTSAATLRGLPVFTEPVPAGRTKALLTYADASTTLVTGLTPGGVFNTATAVIGAGKGKFGASELITREWQA